MELRGVETERKLAVVKSLRLQRESGGQAHPDGHWRDAERSLAEVSGRFESAFSNAPIPPCQ